MNEKTEEIKEVIEDYFYLENDEWHLVSGEEDGVVSIVRVPVEDLLKKWESLVSELSSKEVKLLIKKEYIKEQSFKIEQETDFKEIYGKNNADIRKQHIKGELADVYDEVQGLELSINWIRSYIPLLKEAIRSKPYLDKVKTAQAVYDWLQE